LRLSEGGVVMRKTILGIVIVLLVTTPCLAKEIEPDGFFSIEGTLWYSYGIIFSFFPPVVIVGSDEIGFYKGKVYYYVSYGDKYIPIVLSSYIDLLVVSIACSFGGGQISLAIMQPIGISVRITGGIINFSPLIIPFFTIEILYKVEDNWTQPEDEPPTE
jgi:hypothetical protein